MALNGTLNIRLCDHFGVRSGQQRHLFMLMLAHLKHIGQILLQRQHHRRYASNPQRNRTAIHFEVRERLAAELGERTHIATQHLTVQLARKAVNRPQIVHDLDQKPRVDGYRGGQRAGRGRVLS